MEHSLAEHTRRFEAHPDDAARATLTRWTEAVASGRIEAILELYAPDAVLVPTLSNEIAVTADCRRKYFEFFLSDGGPDCTLKSVVSRTDRKHGTATVAGIYAFRFRRPTGEETVPARFLFTLEEIGSRWMIIGHHSSRCV